MALFISINGKTRCHQLWHKWWQHMGCTIFVNGWCNFHCSILTMATLLFRVGCTCCCPLMTISHQSPPLTFIWAIVLLLLQHNLASYSSFKLTILRASLVKFTGTRQTFQSPELPKHTFSHTKGSLQPDGLPHYIWRVLTLVSGTQHSPLSVSTMLGPKWFFKTHTKAYNHSFKTGPADSSLGSGRVCVKTSQGFDPGKPGRPG